MLTPDFSLPLIVHTDASKVGLGAVLSQVRVGEKHPVTYISRKLLSNEKNYSTVEKEALDKLRYHLLGREFSLLHTCNTALLKLLIEKEQYIEKLEKLEAEESERKRVLEVEESERKRVLEGKRRQIERMDTLRKLKAAKARQQVYEQNECSDEEVEALLHQHFPLK